MKESAVERLANAAFKNARSLMVVLLVFFFQTGFLQTAFAVGVGATDVRSSLGENLLIHIPLFSVENPDSFIVSTDTAMYGDDPDRELTATLDRSNSQLTVVVSSTWPMVEPYVQFDLLLQDGNVVQQKDIVVLLEYKPGVSITDPLRSREVAPVVQISRAPQTNQATNTSRTASASVAPGSTMGPYDVAQAGQIPEKFGAVLDGQSLWRVARRINGAMGVSVEQMMVALHATNPEAFLTGSVDSLAAGSYLTIPSAKFVKQVSDNEAKQRLGITTSLSKGATDTVSPIVSLNPQAQNQVETTDTESTETELAEQSNLFMIGGESEELLEALDSISGSTVSLSPEETTTTLTADDTSYEIADNDISFIKALSKTVGELMRDNIDREQRIQSLEARLATVETTIDSVGLPAADSQSVSNNQSARAIPSELARTANQSGSESNRWIWPASFALLLALGLFLRSYLGNRGRTQKLFSTFETDVADKIVAAKTAADEIAGTGFTEKKSKTDYSALESHKSQRSEEDDEEDEIEGVSYHEFDDGLTVDDEDDSVEPTSVTTVDTPSVTLEVPNKSFLFEAGNVKVFPRESDLTPQKKNEIIKDLDELIAEERFDEVRDLLDMFRGKQLDEANYHFQRLRLLLEEKDEHGFYEYFNMVENKFQDVDGDLKMDLANLVSRLNQN